MKTQTKSRALLLVCVLVLAMALTAVFAFSASAADVTELTNYSLVLSDGVDIKVNGTVAEADLEKDIKVVATCHDETTYDVTVENGAFSVVIPLSVTHYADTVKVDLVVDDEIVATENVSIKANVALILADAEIPAAVKTLASEVIRYGAAALTYLGYAEEAEAFVADLELADSIKPEWKPDLSLDKGVAADITINKVSMELADRINLIFTTDKPVDGRIVEADLYDVEVDGNTIKVVGIPVSAFFTPFTVGVYDGEAAVSNEVTMSPAAYITKAAEKDEKLLMSLTLYAIAAHEATTHKIVEAYEPVPTCQAAGLKTYTCEGCGHYKEEKLAIDPAIHSKISYTVANNNITYTCANCDKTWTSTSLMLADGANTNAFEGNKNTNAGFVGGSAGYPNIVDGHYEFVKAPTPATSQGQFRLIKTTTGATVSGNATANRLGFVSISLQAVDVAVAHPDHGASWSLNIASNAEGSQWTTEKGKAKGFSILDGVPGDGSKAKTYGGVVIDLAEDGFTRVDISFVPVENDMYLLTYYVDGVAVDAVVADNLLFNYTPNCLYFTCNASYVEGVDVQQSVVFDDLLFAFTDATASDFFPKNHVHAPGTEFEEIDDKTHGVKCKGCDAFVGTAAHEFDFSGATCGGEATGICDCGATTTKVIKCTLVASDIVDKVVTYKCTVCESEHTIAAGWAQSFANGATMSVGGGGTGANVDGAFKISATSDPSAAIPNTTISPTTNGIVTSATTAILGFDIKGSEERNGNFVLQWKVNSATTNNWSGSPAKKFTVDAKGNILMDNKDTGYDLSADAFTSIVIKITITPGEASSTIKQDLWINGMYVGAYEETKTVGGLTLATNNTYAQFCVANKTVNDITLDNLFLADVPAGAEGNDISAYLTAK